MLLAICTTQVKKSKKEKKNKGTKNLLQGYFNPDPPNGFRTKNERLYPLDHLVKR